MHNSVDIDALTSHQSHRPLSRYSRASHLTNFDDETVSSAKKRIFKSNLPKLKIDARSSNYSKNADLSVL